MSATDSPRPPIDLRRRRFGHVVDRVITAAQQRGMTIADIEKATGVGNTTFYRWRKGEWNEDPRASQVKRFFSVLGGDDLVAEAYRALGWSLEPTAAEPTPLTDDPDIRAVMRVLNDPNTPPILKLMIRRQLRALARQAEDAEDE